MASVNKKQKKSAFYYALSKKDTGIVGRPIRVSDVEMEDQLGYTSEGSNIHVAYEHDIMNGLSEHEKIALREGVNAHEVLHQIFTDFVAHKRIISSYPSHERQIFAFFFNCLEDAAIENFAHQVMGGTMLSSLRFSIGYIYSKSEGIENAPNPLAQLTAALINFGDMGLIKGKWTFPEAKSAFVKIAPLFAKGVEEPNCLKRLKITKEIMEIARDLWKDVAEQQKMMEELAEELKKHMKSAANGTGRGKDADDEGDGEGASGSAGGSGSTSKKKNRRNVTIKKVSKEEFERMKKEAEESGSGSGGDAGSGDVTVYTCDEATSGESSDASSSGTSSGRKKSSEPAKKKRGRPRKNAETEKGEAEKSKGEKTESEKSASEKSADESANGEETNGETSESKESSDENGKKSESKTDGKESDSDSDKSAKDAEGNDNPFTAPKTDKAKYNENIATPEDYEAEEGIDEIAHEDYMLTDEDIARIESETESAINDFERMSAEEEKTPTIDNFPVSSPSLGKRSCLNYRVQTTGATSLEMSYANLLSKLNPGIKALASQLKRIFENDQEEREYRNSGRINVKRMHTGRVTSRIFDKKRAPVGKSDFAVEILVDESGSMSGSRKDEAARNCCIALAEVFNELNIPVYIIGFTADTQGYDVVHNHYITWKNTKGERLKLLNITARANNLDGYSIRYATEVLKKRNCAHKLLIVLSDGQPAAHRYYDGVHDTKQAIRDAKKHVNVLGVAIGNADTETIHYMYEKDFLHISTVNDLFSGLSKTLQKMMKYWGE